MINFWLKKYPADEFDVIFILSADGAGGKGTWGKLLDTDGESHLDRNDPNYDSGEVIAVSVSVGKSTALMKVLRSAVKIFLYSLKLT